MVKERFDFGCKKKYALFLCGDKPKNYIWFKKNICIECFIDDEMAGMVVDGEKVVSKEYFFNTMYDNEIGIIIGNGDFSRTLMLWLESQGLKYMRDFCFYRDFRYFYELYKKNICKMFYTEILITTFCNLKCRDCTYQIPYRKIHKHRSYDEICRDIDSYFKIVDKVEIFRILGGEPLLHPNVVDIVKYIGDKYGRQIGRLFLVTNGTIPISQDLLKTLRKYNVCVVLSDYSKNVPNVDKKLKAIVKELESNWVAYKVISGDWWLDMGDNKFFNNFEAKALKNLFQKCQTICRVLYDGKIFYCGKSIMCLEENKIKEEDFSRFEFFRLTGQLNEFKAKKELVEFCAGWDKELYLSACNFCKGYGLPDSKNIPSGVQLEAK